MHRWIISESKIKAADDLHQIILPITPPGNGNVGKGPRHLPKYGFKVSGNLPFSSCGTTI